MAVPDFPSHTISVERAVKRVSKAGKHVTSEDRRDGVILSQIEACRLLPKFESKQDLMNLVQYAKHFQEEAFQKPIPWNPTFQSLRIYSMESRCSQCRL